MNVQFVYPWVLFLIWLVPALAAWAFVTNRRLRARLAQFVSPAMQAKLFPNASGARFAWQLGLVSGGLLLMLVAAARPQWGTREEVVFQRGRDLVIALDVSLSMLANDVHPNRLARAKTDILDLIGELRGDRAALLAFRYKGILLCPLTTDYAYLRQALEAAGPDSAPRGETDIGDGIAKALDAFESEEGSHKAIILISDGEDLSGRALAAAQKAAECHIPIFTVGLGSPQGAGIPDPNHKGAFLDFKGQRVTSKLNNETLLGIARATQGAYIPVETAGVGSTTLGTLYADHLRKITAQDLEETRQRRYVERYQVFLLPGLLMALAAAFLSRGRLCVSSAGKPKPPGAPNVRIAAARLAAFALVAAGAQGATNAPAPAATTNAPPVTADVPPGREGARIAQSLYARGKYAEAAAAYLEAARSASRRSQTDFRYNAAVAQFKAGQYKEAADILKEIASSVQGERLDASSGLGAALYRAAAAAGDGNATNLAEKARLLKDAGEAFKDAVRARPDSDVGRRNLGVVLHALPEAEEKAHIAELVAKYEKTPPADLANQLLSSQRRIVEQAPAAFTNDSPNQIRELEALAAEQKADADLWIPLKGKLLAALAQQKGQDANQQKQLAALEQLVESTRDNMLNASAGLRDLDAGSYQFARNSENGIYALWRGIAPYPMILQEDLRLQTNVLSATRAPEAAAEERRREIETRQGEARSLTELFVNRFSASVPEGGTEQAPAPQPPPAAGQKPPEAGPAGTNAPAGISAETRRKILDLAAQAATAQTNASTCLARRDMSAALSEEDKSYRLLKEIEDLLPKNPQQNSSEQQEQKDQQKPQPSEQKQPQENQQPPQPQENQEQKPAEEQKPQEPKQNLDQQKLQALLDKALQREKEHEEEKRQKRDYMSPSPIDRDW